MILIFIRKNFTTLLYVFYLSLIVSLGTKLCNNGSYSSSSIQQQDLPRPLQKLSSDRFLRLLKPTVIKLRDGKRVLAWNKTKDMFDEYISSNSADVFQGDQSPDAFTQYVLSPKINECSNENSSLRRPLLLLTICCIASSYFERRQLIRNTWASKSNNNTSVVLFLLGSDKNQTLNELVRREFEQYNDIIQVKAHDSYYTLTRKVRVLVGVVVLFTKPYSQSVRLRFFFL